MTSESNDAVGIIKGRAVKRPPLDFLQPIPRKAPQTGPLIGGPAPGGRGAQI
jgi:hypothetical protein